MWFVPYRCGLDRSPRRSDGVRGRSLSDAIAQDADVVDLELDQGTRPQVSAQLQSTATCDRAAADHVSRLELYGARAPGHKLWKRLKHRCDAAVGPHFVVNAGLHARDDRIEALIALDAR